MKPPQSTALFVVLGADGKEYPAPSRDALTQWYIQGSVNQNSKIWSAELGSWTNVAELGLQRTRGTHVCTTCGYEGAPIRVVPGSTALGLLLLLLFIIPGLIYAVWQQTAVYQGCPKCKGRAMIPRDMPAAKQLAADQRHERPCPACAEPILVAAKKCKHCGTDLGS